MQLHIAARAFSALAIFATFSASAESRIVERCGVLARDSNSELKTVVIDGFGVVASTQDGNFSLPADRPENIEVVQCGRASLIPEPDDYLVVAAGYPFSIVSGERVAVLQVENGRLQFKMLDGEMTDQEVKEIGIFLDQAQTKFNSAP